MEYVYPIRLEASLHSTIWGGRRLEREGWKQIPTGADTIGESWETEISTIVQNGPLAGKTLGTLVEELGAALLGEQAMAIFGRHFPLLAKFIDANDKLSVQVHPDDEYAAQYEGGKMGKTEFWYILAAEPGAYIVHGFSKPTSRVEVEQAIQDMTLDTLLHEANVTAGDVIFVPAGTVHAIGSGVMLYELQEYSDITYRLYDYGRLTAAGTPRDLHIECALDVTHYDRSSRIKVRPVPLTEGAGYADRCLVACKYFVTRELTFRQGYHNLLPSPGPEERNEPDSSLQGQTGKSCIILSSLGAELQVRYGPSLSQYEHLSRGQTMVLPAALGTYAIEGSGVLLFSYVPTPGDEVWQLWEANNSERG